MITEPLTLTVAGRSRSTNLHLRATFYCCLDSAARYLSVEDSKISLGLADVPDPLFRYEYVRTTSRAIRLPAAHLQVHGHRDEASYLMIHADEGRPKQRWRQQRVPRLAELHFPVGGDRFRPCLEDVIAVAANELGAKLRHGGWKALDEGRAEWRRLQLASAVRDALTWRQECCLPRAGWWNQARPSIARNGPIASNRSSSGLVRRVRD